MIGCQRREWRWWLKRRVEGDCSAVTSVLSQSFGSVSHSLMKIRKRLVSSRGRQELWWGTGGEEGHDMMGHRGVMVGN